MRESEVHRTCSRGRMKALVIGVALVLAGCAHTEDLTGASCVPAGVPGTVVLKREAYLYRFDNEQQISLRDSRYQYIKSGASAQDRVVTLEPLKVLPVGTVLTIERVSRETSFDGPIDVIELAGVAHIDDGYKFRYVWGVSNKIHSAPWEDEVNRPLVFDRVVDCSK